MVIVARCTRINSRFPRRTICCGRRPSASVSRRARNRSAIRYPAIRHRVRMITAAAP
jgi:hypothetical protein